MIMHICLNLETALDMALYRNGYQLEHDENGIGLTDTANPDIRDVLGLPKDMKQSEIVNQLEQMKKEGYTAIPSEGCNNHKGGICQGHEKPREVGPMAGALHK